MIRIYKIFTAIFIFLITLSCEKDVISYEELYKKAEVKYQEMKDLTQSISCGQINQWSVDTLPLSTNSHGYLPIHPDIKSEYDILKKEYINLFTQALKLDDRPQLQYYDYSPHFGIKCMGGHAQVYLLKDFTLEETRLAVNERIETLQKYYTDQPCKNSSDWISILVKKECSPIWIPFLIKEAPTDGFNKISVEYSFLYNHLRDLDESLQNCPAHSTAPPRTIRCENNKPILIF